MILKELTNYTNEDEIMKHVNVKAKSFSAGVYKHPQDNTIYRNVYIYIYIVYNLYI